MKMRLIILFISTGLIIAGCSDVRRNPGRVYVPDMTYSRAYETYAALDSDKFTSDAKELGRKIFYNHMPVAGTIARGEEMAFTLAKDAAGRHNKLHCFETNTQPINSPGFLST
jgi:hypothetical protein